MNASEQLLAWNQRMTTLNKDSAVIRDAVERELRAGQWQEVYCDAMLAAYRGGQLRVLHCLVPTLDQYLNEGRRQKEALGEVIVKITQTVNDGQSHYVDEMLRRWRAGWHSEFLRVLKDMVQLGSVQS